MSELSTEKTMRERIRELREQRDALAGPKRKPRRTNYQFQVTFSPKANPPRPRVRDHSTDSIRVKCSCHEEIHVSFTAAASAHGFASSSITNAFKRAQKRGGSAGIVKGVRFERVES